MVYKQIMIRTQVYFPREELDLLRAAAYAKKTTVSGILRTITHESLKAGIKGKSKVKKEQTAGQFLLSLANEAERLHIRGPKDLSTHVDEYLYGGRK
jgi:hypothetical protein